MARRITPAALAKAADLNRIWVNKAVERGFVNTDALDGEDVIVLRVLALADQIVWPGERRSRSATRDVAIWQSVVVGATRDALTDPGLGPNTLLWLMPNDVRISRSMAEALVILTEIGPLCAVRIPIGDWVSELPEGFDLPAIPTPPTAGRP
ncbi:hypothetical protein GCM10010441_07950 [Kitasatospora paracochleata]|uniref:Uncharacterized protein n=1 Tax=Kitasatospora paracochleata TaxID=58354 RepID=A0ABT1J9K4_9ACTN|nr:hypothetical protein [Kitasatospora paracochleata]MCP2314132.1 hypothetical protein [Kitasatospora paracochleata]